MHSLTIGALTIPYDLQRSALARRAKITLTPDAMVVVVPEAAAEADIERMLHSKRRWIVETRYRMEDLEAERHRVARFGNGAKIPYRGRMARLHLSTGDGDLVTVTYRNGFRISTPSGLTGAALDNQVEIALRLWLRRKIRDDAKILAKRYAATLSVKPSGVHIKDLRHMWGTCGQDRSINLNWQLVFAPMSVVEYVILHELTHLKERNHGPDFWALIHAAMPDFQKRKAWLEANEHLLGVSRLGPDAGAETTWFQKHPWPARQRHLASSTSNSIPAKRHTLW